MDEIASNGEVFMLIPRNYLIICGFVIVLVLLIFGLGNILPLFKMFFSFVWKIIMPFILAGLISYLLYPLMKKLQKHKIKKVFAIMIIFLTLLSLSYLAIYKSLPIFVEQLEELSVQLPQLNMLYEDVLQSFYERTAFLPEMVHDKMDELIEKIESSTEKKIGTILSKLTDVVDYIILFTIIPVLIFYFLKDFQTFTIWIQNTLPKKYRGRLGGIITAIDDSLGAYVRGQFIISLTIMLITFTIYELLGLKYALLLAMFIGVMNIIPYFGPIIGTIPAILIALTMSWKVVLIVGISTLCIQIIESSMLSPYIMGKSVALHPVMIILILLIGAEFGGVIGMVVAVPVVTISKAIYLQIRPIKQQSN